MNLSEKDLDIIFGADSKGACPEERAQSSKKLWVRSSEQLCKYTLGATGLVMSSLEALEVFGIEGLCKCEIEQEGSLLLILSLEEPARTIRLGREAKGLTQEELAEKAEVFFVEVQNAENQKKRSSMLILAKLCKILSLDVRRICFLPYEELRKYPYKEVLI